MHKNFWLPLICSKVDNKYVASKGNIMCWLTFVSLVIISFTELFGLKIENIREISETLKYVFSTTFLYSIGKKGVDAYEKKGTVK